MPLTFKKLKYVCVIDTEYETNKNAFEKTSLPYSQNQLLQVAYSIICDNGDFSWEDTVIKNHYLKPVGLPKNFIHGMTGLSYDFLEEFGENVSDVMDSLFNDLRRCYRIVAHNSHADLSHLRVELDRLGRKDDIEYLNSLDDFCLMKYSKEKMRLLRKDGQLKKPSLGEFYKHCFPNCDHLLNHCAVDDVKDTIACYMHFRKKVSGDWHCPWVHRTGERKGRRCIKPSGEKGRYCKNHRNDEEGIVGAVYQPVLGTKLTYLAEHKKKREERKKEAFEREVEKIKSIMRANGVAKAHNLLIEGVLVDELIASDEVPNRVIINVEDMDGNPVRHIPNFKCSINGTSVPFSLFN